MLVSSEGNVMVQIPASEKYRTKTSGEATTDVKSAVVFVHVEHIEMRFSRSNLGLHYP